jgi:hypothetical protein
VHLVQVTWPSQEAVGASLDRAWNHPKGPEVDFRCVYWFSYRNSYQPSQGLHLGGCPLNGINFSRKFRLNSILIRLELEPEAV